MIARDRELLARVARVNSELGRVVVELFHRQDGGELPAEGVRELGRRLADLGAELLASRGAGAASDRGRPALTLTPRHRSGQRPALS